MLTILFAAAAATAAPATTADDDSAVKCIRQPVTGSLLGTKKVCRTKAEWRELERLQSQQVRDDYRATSPGQSNG